MKQRRSHQSGVTLVEVGIVLAIVGILVGTAIPSFQQSLQRRSLEGVATQIAGDMQYLRTEAVARNRTVSIIFGRSAAGSCYVLHTGGTGDCECGVDTPATCVAGASEIKTVSLPASQGLTIAANVDSMQFSPTFGTTTPGGRIDVTAQNGAVIRQVVNSLGRTRTCTPEGALPGYRTC
jgi:type IV fimbrial biogenesis protein FimT